MTVAPATLAEMIASTRFEATRAAIAATLKRLMKGVTIETHPGKLDVNDVLAKAIVAAPGIAIGWTRMRSVRDLGGTYGLPIDWIAYIVAEDYADRQAGRRVDRALVANAIGARLLLILQDTDTASWGLTGLMPPLPDPEPEMRPVFTMKSAENASALYAVTWTQALVLEGVPIFDRGHATSQGVDFEGDGLPPEFAAVFGDQS